MVYGSYSKDVEEEIMRLRKKPGMRERLEQEKQRVHINPKGCSGKWKEIFGNDHPIRVELGMGKGDFISKLSEQNPVFNYIGVDMKDELLDITLKKILKKGNPNVRLALFNVEDLLEVFAPQELDRIYLNFSDPWPKTRHARRRLTYRGFLEKYETCLKPSGEVHFKTDSESLFESSLNEFRDAGWQLKNITFDLHQSPFIEGNVMTEYERKFVERGLKIYRCESVSPGG
jgi:tRNA (guanine-N7-)-methyltransferase